MKVKGYFELEFPPETEYTAILSTAIMETIFEVLDKKFLEVHDKTIATDYEPRKE